MLETQSSFAIFVFLPSPIKPKQTSRPGKALNFTFDYRFKIDNPKWVYLINNWAIVLMSKYSRKSSHNELASDRIFIGVAGGSAAGKTTLCDNINRQMAFDRNFKVETISLDSFYKSIDKHEVDVSEYNFDHPLALDFDLAFDVLQKLKYTTEPVAIPQYSFVEHARLPEPAYINPANIILFQGLMAFHDERIRNMMTYKIFINCDDDIRLCRRIKRDTTERGRTIISVLAQYNKFVKNSFRDFIYPTIGYADLVIPGSRNNRISVDFIVQHIKNVARKKNIFKTAQDTKVFLFGENEYYDMNVKKNYKESIELGRESFLIFPTSDEHRRQLDFFFNTLMSQAFTQDYFQEVYVYQFIKIVKSLLKQLFELKNLKTQNMELISIFEVRERLKKDSMKPIKLIFVPIIFDKEQHFLSFIKPLLKPKETIIIINLFCDMLYPTRIYQSDIEGLIFLNLYLVANKKRLLDILSANNLNIRKGQEDHKYPRDWLLYNRQLVEKGLEFLANQFKIEYKKYSWHLEEELFNIYKKKEEEKEAFFTYPSLDETKLEWTSEDKTRKIVQIPALTQEHPNLCGYYALHNIKSYPNLSEMRSKEEFLENYIEFTHTLQRKSDSLRHLKEQLFEPLDPHFVPQIIYDHQLFDHKEIVPLYISENYIVNEKKCLTDVSGAIMRFKTNHIKQLFFLMGVYNHFFVIKMNDCTGKDLKLEFIDSMNTPIGEIMSNTCSIPNPTKQDLNKVQNMKTAIETVLEWYYGDATVQGMLVRLRAKEILDSFSRFKENGELKKWLQDEFPARVIENDLFSEMRLVTEEEIGKEMMDKLKLWFAEPFVEENVIKMDSSHHPLKKFRIESI